MNNDPDSVNYRAETGQFEKWFGNLPGALFPLALLVTAWLCLQPMAAIAFAGSQVIVDGTLQIVWYALMAGIGGTAAIVFGAAAIAQGIFRAVGRFRTLFGILFILLQFVLAILQTALSGRDFAGGYLAETLATNFVGMALIIGLSFIPQVFALRRYWFFPVYAVIYLLPAFFLVRIQIAALGGDPGALAGWSAGCLLQVAFFTGAVGRSGLRGFASQILRPQ